ncbi:MAG TPA: hypothetical protein VGX75_05600 [bacterium]|jgi:hypothetical protein|nr:hypothetical protein [bacterium]
MFNGSPAALVLGGLFSLLGMAALVYGRKTDRIGMVLGGIVLTVFPYFVGNPIVIVLVGIATMAGMYFFPEWD